MQPDGFDRMDNPTDDKLIDDREKMPSELDMDALYIQIRDWYKVDFAHSAEWRRNAKTNFDFVAGEQWDAKDKAALNDQNRPVITFNRTLSIIKAVAGVEINGRHETVFLPRGTSPGEIKANELLTGASQWMADGCDAEDEQSEAFQDSLICGMGWTEATLEYEDEPDGEYVERKIDPIEMVWDNAARGKNILDARRLYRVRKMSLWEARALAASVGEEVFDDADLDATWATGLSDKEDLKPIEERRLRFENTGPYDPKNEVHLVHAQWYEKEAYYRVADPISGKIEAVEADQFEKMRAMAEEAGFKLDFVKAHRKVYKQALIGGRVLGGVRPCLSRDRFSFQCITGEKNRNKGTWFGLVDLMKDPQMWANKWMSQTLHILNATAKGGIIAEKDAFEDIRAAQDTYAKPDAITWASPGAISKGKIMQKPGVGIPTGYINLLEFAISSIRDVTGINMELLGLRDANQPGILEAQRKQAAMTILATLFDSLRRYRKNIGRIRLHLIQDYLADGRLIRIAGEEGMKAVPLIREETFGDYEVIIDDAPTSPNQKEQTWVTIQQVIPAFRDILTPEAVVTILEYSPLPSQLVDTFKSMLNKPNPDADEAKAIARAKEEAAIAKDRAQADKYVADADAARAKAEADRSAAILDLINGIPIVNPDAHANAAMQNLQSPDPWRDHTRILPDDPFVVEPGVSDLPQVPVLPQVPTSVQPDPAMAEEQPPMPPIDPWSNNQ